MKIVSRYNSEVIVEGEDLKDCKKKQGISPCSVFDREK